MINKHKEIISYDEKSANCKGTVKKSKLQKIW